MGAIILSPKAGVALLSMAREGKRTPTHPFSPLPPPSARASTRRKALGWCSPSKASNEPSKSSSS